MVHYLQAGLIWTANGMILAYPSEFFPFFFGLPMITYDITCIPWY